MIESHRETASRVRSQCAIEFSDNTFVVDAALIGELLHLPASQVPILMRAGRITSACERGIDEHAGEFRISFFYRNRRARLNTDPEGRILRKSTIDFGDRPIPEPPDQIYGTGSEFGDRSPAARRAQMTDIDYAQNVDLPGNELEIAKMPGHWLLARLGKRVLRPGGLKLTRALLDELAIGPSDEVVEFAPGLGVTARMILKRRPQRYTGVERDANARQWTTRQLPSDPNISVIAGTADRTGLPPGCASVVVGEAMLSMSTATHKRLTAAEAFRLLRSGGRYGIHELAIVPDGMPPDQ